VHHLLGLSEAAARLGVSKQRLTQLMASYTDFPKPVAELSVGRIWSTEDIDSWNASNPRRPGRPPAVRCWACGDTSAAGTRAEIRRFSEKHAEQCGHGKPTTELAGLIEDLPQA
jgi:predicted DNA-binding transcriptional regulator AlpA